MPQKQPCKRLRLPGYWRCARTVTHSNNDPTSLDEPNARAKWACMLGDLGCERQWRGWFECNSGSSCQLPALAKSYTANGWELSPSSLGVVRDWSNQDPSSIFVRRDVSNHQVSTGWNSHWATVLFKKDACIIRFCIQGKVNQTVLRLLNTNAN